jgi:hypothetical protein
MKSQIEGYIEEHIERLVRNEVNEIVNLNRQNICKKRFGLF